jgi:hypothetical protein
MNKKNNNIIKEKKNKKNIKNKNILKEEKKK